MGGEHTVAWAEKRGPWYRVRFRDADGVVRTTPDKYRTKKEATDAAEEIDTDTRRGVFIDPKASRTSLEDWVAEWRDIHRVSPATKAKYDQYLDKHILPAFGQVGLDEVRRLAVKRWAGELSGRYAEATVRGIITLFSLVMTAAVEDKMVATNPIQGLRLADRRAHHRARPAKRRPTPTGEQVLAIAQRAGQLGGRVAYAMVIHAAFTGMRWGEITGLDRTNCHTHDRKLLIDPDTGSLHEVAGRLWLGPPKSDAAARRVDLPPFLAMLLEEIIDSHTHDQVFASPTGRWLRRSNFARRIWRPACDGDPERNRPPILPGAVFHGLRHFHKTLLDETGLPDVIVYERMGHHMPGVGGVYSHVTDTMRRQLIDELQACWVTLTHGGRRPAVTTTRAAIRLLPGQTTPSGSQPGGQPGALLPVTTTQAWSSDHDPHMGCVRGPVEHSAPVLLPTAVTNPTK
jgi:integrase